MMAAGSRKIPSVRRDFEIAVICALPLEADAVMYALDHVYDRKLARELGKSAGDPNSYVFGRCENYNVVVVTLPNAGSVKAATAATSLHMSFCGIRLAFLVGICGAVPMKNNGNEILLGDVIIGETIVQLDYGKQYPWGFQRKKDIQDVPGRLGDELLSFLQRLKVGFQHDILEQNAHGHLERLQRRGKFRAEFPGREKDKLFPPNYPHKHHTGCLICGIPDGPACDEALKTSCDGVGCNTNILINRDGADGDAVRRGNLRDSQPSIHFGAIGTADTVIKSGMHRDEYAKSNSIIAFEMESAGIWEKLNCLVIKGVADYADAHKNNTWQNYAAAAAASVMKEILVQYVRPDEPSQPHSSRENSFPGLHTSLVYRSLDNHTMNEEQMNSLSQAFDDSIRSFRRDVERDNFQIPNSIDLRELKKELKRIQADQDRTKSLRNLRRIEKFMGGVAHMGTVLEECLEKPEPARVIWGAVRFLIRVSKNNSDWLDSVLNAYEKLGKNIPLVSNKDLYQHNTWLFKVIVQVFDDILDFHRGAMDIFSNYETLKDVFRSFWVNFTPTIDNITEHLGSHKTFIESKETVIAVQGGRLAREDIQDIQQHIRDYKQDKEQHAHKEEERKRGVYNEVQEWLSCADVASKHLKICEDRQRYPNSGDWILRHEKVKNWLSPDESIQPILWVKARPGTGKTYLASIIINECIRRNRAGTGYFYCSSESDDAVSILRGILSQLLSRNETLAPYCREKKRNLDSARFADIHSIEAMLTTFCKRISRVYIVIDGLDECATIQQDILLNIFHNLVKNCDGYSPGKLRILLLSRPLDLKTDLEPIDSMTLTTQDNAKDIEGYCQHWGDGIREKFNLENEDINFIVRKTCIKADGMFLFARLVMGNLKEQPNRNRLFDILADNIFPEDLNGAYAKIMERLKQDLERNTFQYTQLLLGWVVRSKRPLKWTEIQAALSTRLGINNTLVGLDRDEELKDSPLKVCGSLIQILEGDRVELVHSTARNFLEGDGNIDLLGAECDLGLRCLRYLTHDFFRSDITDEELEKSVIRGDLALQDYAVSTWFMHITSIIKAKDELFRARSQSTEDEIRRRKDRLTEQLKNFVNFYHPLCEDSSIIEEARKECEIFQEFAFHDSLLTVWCHIRAEQAKDYASRNKISLEPLGKALDRNRTLIERLSNEKPDDISKHYGQYAFRCPKVLCFYFHHGFGDQKIRDHHVARHDRPFHCNEPGCCTNGLGFVSNNALVVHMSKFHPDKYLEGDTFASVNRVRVVENARWQCHLCHKSFTRNAILIDHIRTHNGERPHACAECPWTFTRKSDLRRHEKSHERRRQR